MNLTIMFIMMLVILIMNLLFFLMSKKNMWEISMTSSFECGYTSYFYSRFSFSIHYYMIALIFLFLDLELCYMMPFLNECLSNKKLNYIMIIFMLVLVLGLITEWKEDKLNWLY